ncbi:MAG: phosphonopyruvate decarboxylase, partial [Ruminococcus sp.]|nr:phosphonopyruvate decarboxylase [Ruminococcus sp.]
GFDLLTVGSMGHCSSIALGIALDRPQCRVWCIDGDGAMLMHMGSMAVIGSQRPGNLIHILINNCAHETVGGMPTAAGGVDAAAIAAACGYGYTASVTEEQELDRELNSIRDRKGPVFLEIKCGIGSRKDLGRPTTTAIENKKAFMEHLKGL